MGGHSAVRPRRRSSARRRASVLVELLLAGAICLLGFQFGATWMRVHEAAWVAGFLRLVGVASVSGVLPGHLLVFRTHGEILDALVTPSCSSVLSLLGLTALTATVLRTRRWHAAWGLVVATGAVLLANDLRLAASTMAGVWWGGGALVLFHDWVGTLWTFGATLGGFLLMVSLTLPEARRAEQDLSGRHTARRPSSWARPGLGYRVDEVTQDAGRGGSRSLTGLFYRYVLPRPVNRRLAARREHARIDYRLGHLSPEERRARVQALAADGLGVHTASLLAVATYDTDREVLDVLAEAVAARQWEPVTSQRVAALRLWARGWLQSRRLAQPLPLPPAPAPAPVPAPLPAPVPAPLPAPVPAPLPAPVPAAATQPVRSFARPAAPAPAVPTSFARPVRGGDLHDPEDPR